MFSLFLAYAQTDFGTGQCLQQEVLSFSCQVYSFCPETCVWKGQGSFECAGFNAGAVGMRDRIYILGGDYSPDEITDEVQVNKWFQPIETLPSCRYFSVSVGIPCRCTTVGGVNGRKWHRCPERSPSSTASSSALIDTEIHGVTRRDTALTHKHICIHTFFKIDFILFMKLNLMLNHFKNRFPPVEEEELTNICLRNQPTKK